MIFTALTIWFGKFDILAENAQNANGDVLFSVLDATFLFLASIFWFAVAKQGEKAVKRLKQQSF